MRLRWWLLLVLIIVLLGVRLALPGIIRAQVNERLGQMPAYSGTVADIDVALWRGAYVLKDLSLVKRGPRIPVAFITVPRMEVALDWSQLAGRRVAMVTLEDNTSFVDSPQPPVADGAGVSWRRSRRTFSARDRYAAHRKSTIVPQFRLEPAGRSADDRRARCRNHRGDSRSR